MRAAREDRRAVGVHKDAPECAACIMLTGLAQPLLVAFSNALLLVAKSNALTSSVRCRVVCIANVCPSSCTPCVCHAAAILLGCVMATVTTRAGRPRAGQGGGVPVDVQAGEVCVRGAAAAAAGRAAALPARRHEAAQAHGCLLRLQPGAPRAGPPACALARVCWHLAAVNVLPKQASLRPVPPRL